MQACKYKSMQASKYPIMPVCQHVIIQDNSKIEDNLQMKDNPQKEDDPKI